MDILTDYDDLVLELQIDKSDLNNATSKLLKRIHSSNRMNYGLDL